MAYTAWSASASISLGDIRSATTVQASGLVFECTTAGTTGSSEPPWGTDIGSTVTDNNVVWTAISSIYEDVSLLAPDKIIELFELWPLGESGLDAYFWHNGLNENFTGNVQFNSKTYAAAPIKASGFEMKVQTVGTLPRPKITVANLNGAITTILAVCNTNLPGSDLGGSKVVRLRTLAKYLDGQTAADPDAKWPDEIYYVDRKVAETRDLVEFELISKFDLAGMKIPRRQTIANQCQWIYRSSECSYSGSNYWDEDDNVVTSAADDKCGKRLSSCKKRFGTYGQLPYGAFPSVGTIK
jgi:lambda family phage minor tail protein L